jgi:hypothetical protein
MHRLTFILFVLFLSCSAVAAQAQESLPRLGDSVPAAGRSQSDCTGFITKSSVPRDLVVLGGADDDFHSAVRQFVQGDSLFISNHKGGNIAVGAEYSVVRPATELFMTRRYAHQDWEIGKVGKPYEDVGQLRVTHVSPAGTVASVTFSCGPILPGDLVVPFQPRAVPGYTLSPLLDHFAPLDTNKQHGRIAASRNNFGFLGAGTTVYLNLGQKEGTAPGERFRIYKVLPQHGTGSLTSEPTPPEIIGEVVVLTVQSHSCVAMVISSYREISAGDYVEAE